MGAGWGVWYQFVLFLEHCLKKIHTDDCFLNELLLAFLLKLDSSQISVLGCINFILEILREPT